MQGGTTDGNRFIESALQQGAVALVTDSESTWQKVRAERPEFAVALVGHGRRALAEISANFFSHPERSLQLSGVTGTNGKTTTTYLLESMLRTAGRTCILVGTIEYHVGNEVRPSPHTTPESRDLFQLFAEGVAAGATEAVMEVVVARAGAGKSLGPALGHGCVYEFDPGSSRFSRHHGSVFRGEGEDVHRRERSGSSASGDHPF